jgi:hypothetical protein
MRIYRSPKDGVLEIEPLSFSLKWLFALVTIVACVLGYRAFILRTPLKDATIYWGNCYRSDWNALTASSANRQDVDVFADSFNLSDPQELFHKFSVRPVLADFKAKDGQLNVFTFGPREVGRPVDGGSEIPTGPDTHINHWFSIGGSVERSTMGKRFFVDLDVLFATQTLQGKVISRELKRHLRYRGSAPGELIVFAIPVDDELMHLVIVDLNSSSESSQVKGQ